MVRALLVLCAETSEYVSSSDMVMESAEQDRLRRVKWCGRVCEWAYTIGDWELDAAAYQETLIGRIACPVWE